MFEFHHEYMYLISLVLHLESYSEPETPFNYPPKGLYKECTNIARVVPVQISATIKKKTV